MVPTLSDKAFWRVSCEPGLAVCWLIRLLDELKLTRDLSIIAEAQCLCLVLHVFDILKAELEENREQFIQDISFHAND